MRSKKILMERKTLMLELKRYLKLGAITKDDLITKDPEVNPIIAALEKGRKATR